MSSKMLIGILTFNPKISVPITTKTGLENGVDFDFLLLPP